MAGIDIDNHPIHLGLSASAMAEPALAGKFQWYAAYVARHADDAAGARREAMHGFSRSWEMGEMHPKGSALSAGHYAIDAPGVWHAVDPSEEFPAVFTTAGQGIEYRPR